MTLILWSTVYLENLNICKICDEKSLKKIELEKEKIK